MCRDDDKGRDRVALPGVMRHEIRMLDEIEIGRRLPVWHALSEIFLDTELQPADYASIAKKLMAAPYTEEQLHSIFEQEVAPAFIFNLLDVAGEWTPWTSEEVRTIMLGSLTDKAGSLGSRMGARLKESVASGFYGRYLKDEWQKVVAEIKAAYRP